MLVSSSDVIRRLVEPLCVTSVIYLFPSKSCSWLLSISLDLIKYLCLEFDSFNYLGCILFGNGLAIWWVLCGTCCLSNLSCWNVCASGPIIIPTSWATLIFFVLYFFAVVQQSNWRESCSVLIVIWSCLISMTALRFSCMSTWLQVIEQSVSILVKNSKWLR